MGYQTPPTLPDYSKLVFMLNSSGVQEWNPAVYDILKNLIEAVKQSQGVINNTVTKITSAPIPVSCCDAAGLDPTTPGGLQLSRLYSVSGKFSLPTTAFNTTVVNGYPGYLIMPLKFDLIAGSNGKTYQGGTSALALKYSDNTNQFIIGAISLGLTAGVRIIQGTATGNNTIEAKAGLGMNVVIGAIPSEFVPPNDGVGLVTWTFTYMWIKV